MKMLAKIRQNEIYCAETPGGGLEAAAAEASWDTIASCRRSNKAYIGSNYLCSESAQLPLAYDQPRLGQEENRC